MTISKRARPGHPIRDARRLAATHDALRARQPASGLCAIALVAFGLAACPSKQGSDVGLLPLGAPAPEVRGENWNGESFQLDALRGKVALVFFGYTYCPDVCPLTLFHMSEAFRRLEARAKEVAVVFVTVDPERDSRKKLGEYVSAFNPAFHGVRASDLAGTIRAYGLVVDAKKEAPSRSGGYYAVDHTGTIFVVDREGILRARLPHTSDATALLGEVRALLGDPPRGGAPAPSSEGAPPIREDPDGWPQAAPGGLRVSDARVTATIGGSRVSAAYLSVFNPTGEADRLLSVSCPVARGAMLHETRVEGGVVRMVRAAGFVVPAGGSLELAPGGRHVMLTDLAGALVEGSTIALAIRFERTGTVAVDARVLASTPSR